MRRLAILTFLSLFTLGSAAVAQVGPPSSPAFVEYVSDEIVVKFDDSVLAQINRTTAPLGRLGVPHLDILGGRHNVTSILQQFPGAAKRVYRGRVVDLAGWHKVRFAGKVSVEAAARAYKALPGVLDAQPIGIHRIEVDPNDPCFSAGCFPPPNDGYVQWHLQQMNDHDMDAPEAWDVGIGASEPAIIVAILDTGVRYYHKDLGGSDASPNSPLLTYGNIWRNQDETPGNGIDDDGNGYVDDWIGWDFVNGESSCWTGEDCQGADNDPRDFNGHGTHVAGIVGAINNNGYATASVAGGWGNGTLQSTGNGVKLMALRIGWSGRYQFFSEVGYVRLDYAALALRYAADAGARIANASWSSSQDAMLEDAIDYFLSHGGLIFKAAGNDGLESCDFMASLALDGVITVAATDASDLKASFSNYGTCVDVSAPGVDILSSFHNHNDPNPDYIAVKSGTSMAAPNAAAVAALIWSKNPDWTASQVRAQLLDSVDNIDGLNPLYAGKIGAGRVNAYSALQAGSSPTPPDAPSSLTATPVSSSQINLAWTDNSSDEDGFKIERSEGPAFTEIATVPAGVTTFSNTGLTASTEYSYQVRAYNSVGNSGYSNTASTTTPSPPTIPTAPSNLTATAVSSSQIDLAWTDNADNEQEFRIERSQNGLSFAQIATVGPGVKTYQNKGLKRRTRYYYRVRACNVAGCSVYSSIANARTL